MERVFTKPRWAKVVQHRPDLALWLLKQGVELAENSGAYAAEEKNDWLDENLPGWRDVVEEEGEPKRELDESSFLASGKELLIELSFIDVNEIGEGN